MRPASERVAKVFAQIKWLRDGQRSMVRWGMFASQLAGVLLWTSLIFGWVHPIVRDTVHLVLPLCGIVFLSWVAQVLIYLRIKALAKSLGVMP